MAVTVLFGHIQPSFAHAAHSRRDAQFFTAMAPYLLGKFFSSVPI